MPDTEMSRDIISQDSGASRTDDQERSPQGLEQPLPKERIRTGHACEPCRRRRAKCNGVQPRCHRCEEFDIPCHYAESKAQRHQKEKVLSSKAAVYEALLKSLLPRQDFETRRQIQAVLAREDLTTSDTESSHASQKTRGETVARGDAGSPHRQATSSELSRSEGYLGKSSAARWLSDLGDTFNESTSAASRVPRRVPGTNASKIEGILIEAATYHISEFEDELFENVGTTIDLKFLPSRQQADQYVEIYMETIQPFFQVFQKEEFLTDYEEFWSTGVPCKGGVLWQAMLNLILALGCLQSQYLGLRTSAKENIGFFLRARMLSLEPLNLLQIPEREHVQLTTMFAMYLLASNRINRAWLMIGTSVRYAQNLAYHLVNISANIPDSDKELQKRLWHSITLLEHILCFLTGRPLSVREGTMSVELPKALRDGPELRTEALREHISMPHELGSETSDELEVFRRGILLDRILSDTLFELYTASTVKKTWATIQREMASLNIRLSTWRGYLPSRFKLKDIDSISELRSQTNPSLETTYLALRYFSVSILINRLSLCFHWPSKETRIPDQSNRSREVDVDNSRRAIRAAQNLIWVLHSRTSQELYHEVPWWCSLHFIVQGSALLVMEICSNCQHFPSERDNILRDTGMALNILGLLRERNPGAEKAHSSLSMLLDAAMLSRTGRLQSHSGDDTESRKDMDTGSNQVSETDQMLWERAPPNIAIFDLVHIRRSYDLPPVLSPFVAFSPESVTEQAAPSQTSDVSPASS